MLVLVLLGTSTLSVSVARADTTDCTGLNTIPTGNPLYDVENSNAPGGSGCLTVTSNGTGAYRVDSTAFNPSAPQAPAQQFIGYKAIYTGCKFGVCLEPQYPALASSLVSEPTNWAFNFNAATGMKDAVYDMYFNTKPVEHAVPDGAELMVWLNHTSNLQLQGAGTLPDVTIENQLWHVSSVVKTTALGTWNRIVFELANPTTNVTGLDMAPFIKQAESYGVISPNWYQQALEAGFEIWTAAIHRYRRRRSRRPRRRSPARPRPAVAAEPAAVAALAAWRHRRRRWRHYRQGSHQADDHPVTPGLLGHLLEAQVHRASADRRSLGERVRLCVRQRQGQARHGQGGSRAEGPRATQEDHDHGKDAPRHRLQGNADRPDDRVVDVHRTRRRQLG